MSDQYKVSVLDHLLLPTEFLNQTDLLKHANDYSFLFAMIFNGGAANLLSKKSLPAITDEWDIKVAPAGWAFSIWGVIYTLLGGFVYYQSHSNTEIPGGIDEAVIYGQVGRLFAVNMMI